MAFSSKALLITLVSGVAACFAFFSTLARLASRARQEERLREFLAKRNRVHAALLESRRARLERAEAVLQGHLIRTGKVPKAPPKPSEQPPSRNRVAREVPPPDPRLVDLNRQAKENPERTAGMIRSLVMSQDRDQ